MLLFKPSTAQQTLQRFPATCAIAPGVFRNQRQKSGIRHTTLPSNSFPLGVMVIGGGAPPKIHLPYEESSPHGRQNTGTRARNTTGSWESGEMQRSWESEAPTVMEEMAWTSQGLHGDWQTGVPPWIPGPSIQGQGKAGHKKQ